MWRRVQDVNTFSSTADEGFVVSLFCPLNMWSIRPAELADTTNG